MQPLTEDLLLDIIKDANKLHAYLTRVKEASDELDLIDFHTVLNACKDEKLFGEVSQDFYYENFEDLACSDWEGFDYRDYRMVRDTQQEWNPIFKAVGILGNGNNNLFNKLLESVVYCYDSVWKDHEVEQWQQWIDYLKDLNWIRREVGTDMVRIGLLG